MESTLQYRHISPIARCKVCLDANEDMMHALIYCSHAQRFWMEARRGLDLKLHELYPSIWTRDILYDQMISEKDHPKIIIVMWAIWTSRNNVVHDKGSLDPILSMKLTWEAVVLLDIPCQHAKTLPGFGWRPPDDDFVKINTDAEIAFDRQPASLERGVSHIWKLLIH
jgi:hypothetical protein